MSDISTEVLRQEINAIIKTADLSVITGRKVREQIEKKLKISLATRKKDVDSLLMESIKQRQEEDANSAGSDASSAATEPEDNASEEQSDDDNDSSSDDYKGSAKKRSRTPRKAVPKKKRKSINAQDTGTESDEGSDSDYEIPKAQSTGKKSGGGGEKSTAASGRKGTGFTRAYTLSPELSALMGAEALPRHEVVKKVWAIIKERNLYDPKNKQFAICDAELLKVMKVKRFRTFGMLKHLKPHFLN